MSLYFYYSGYSVIAESVDLSGRGKGPQLESNDEEKILTVPTTIKPENK